MVSAYWNGVVLKDDLFGNDMVEFQVKVGLMGRSTEGAEAVAVRSKLQHRRWRQAMETETRRYTTASV